MEYLRQNLQKQGLFVVTQNRVTYPNNPQIHIKCNKKYSEP